MSIWAPPPVPSLAIVTATASPDADPETTTVDGNTIRTDPEVTWATLRGHTTATTIAAASANLTARIEAGLVSTNWDEFSRAVMLFDFSAVGAVTRVLRFAVAMTPNSITNGFGGSVSICESAPLSNTALAFGDYDGYGTTEFANAALSALSVGVEHEFLFNAAGRSFVETALAGSGIVKLGLRLKADLDDAEPSWISNTVDQARFDSADVGGATIPQARMTYIV